MGVFFSASTLGGCGRRRDAPASRGSGLGLLRHFVFLNHDAAPAFCLSDAFDQPHSTLMSGTHFPICASSLKNCAMLIAQDSRRVSASVGVVTDFYGWPTPQVTTLPRSPTAGKHPGPKERGNGDTILEARGLPAGRREKRPRSPVFGPFAGSKMGLLRRVPAMVAGRFVFCNTAARRAGRVLRIP